MIAHLGVNVLNDYFDVKDGTDEANSDYFQQVSGGSRAIELGLISLSGTKKLGLILGDKVLVSPLSTRYKFDVIDSMFNQEQMTIDFITFLPVVVIL